MDELPWWPEYLWIANLDFILRGFCVWEMENDMHVWISKTYFSLIACTYNCANPVCSSFWFRVLHSIISDLKRFSKEPWTAVLMQVRWIMLWIPMPSAPNLHDESPYKYCTLITWFQIVAFWSTTCEERGNFDRLKDTRNCFKVGHQQLLCWCGCHDKCVREIGVDWEGILARPSEFLQSPKGFEFGSHCCLKTLFLDR